MEEIEVVRKIASLEGEIAQLREEARAYALKLQLRDLEMVEPAGRIEVNRGTIDRFFDFEIESKIESINQRIQDKLDVKGHYEKLLSESDE